MSYTRKKVDYPAGLPSEGWRDDAACRGDTSFDWFTDRKPSAAHIQFCAECPVRDDCLKSALYEGQDSAGFRAGLSADARRRLLRHFLYGKTQAMRDELERGGWSGKALASIMKAFRG